MSTTIIVLGRPVPVLKKHPTGYIPDIRWDNNQPFYNKGVEGQATGNGNYSHHLVPSHVLEHEVVLG